MQEKLLCVFAEQFGKELVQDEGFGIRLENDVLVTDSEPVDLMADIPIEADEIEQLMQRS